MSEIDDIKQISQQPHSKIKTSKNSAKGMNTVTKHITTL
jgi:hypothetical protein